MKIFVTMGPFLGDGRGGPLALLIQNDCPLEKVEQVDGFSVSALFDDFGDEFEFYRFEATPEAVQRVLDEAQANLKAYIEYEDDVDYSEVDDCDFDRDDALKQYLEQSKETLESSITNPVKWIREAAEERLKGGAT
jgi:hypothetical protein